LRRRGCCYREARSAPLSSRGLGRRPLTAETGVRIPVAVLRKPCKSQGFRHSGGGADQCADQSSGPRAPAIRDSFRCGWPSPRPRAPSIAYAARVPIARGAGEGVRAALPLRRSTHGVSASFLIRADDDRDYWCKAINNPCSARIPVNEQAAARLALLIGVAVPAPELVDLTGIAGWEFSPGRLIEAGWAHGAAAIAGAFETRTLDHRGDNQNAARHAGFYAVMDWLAGADQQWLYSAPEDNAYYSHDHGHYFPGPDWTPAESWRRSSCARAATATTSCSGAPPRCRSCAVPSARGRTGRGRPLAWSR
jgi:hypothetical protein